jgi:phospholipase A1/A2
VKLLFRQAGKFVWGGAGSGLPVWLLVLLLTSRASALAQDVTSVFVSPPGNLAAGSQASLWLYCMNNSSNAVAQTFERSLDCTLSSEFGSSKTVLTLNPNVSSAKAVIAPGGFVKVEYLFQVPATNGYQVRMDVSKYHQVLTLEVAKKNQLVTLVQDSSKVSEATLPLPPFQNTQAASKASLYNAISNNFMTNLSFYEPVYFIIGSYPAAEFQFSIKYQLLDLDSRWNPLGHSYFAFTQTSLWDLISPDPSFYDSSYKPSLFLFYTNVYSARLYSTNQVRFDLQAGTEHESNGRGGLGERSLYTAYLQPTATFDLPYNLQLTLQPRARLYYWVGPNNPDISDYRGYADLLAALTWKDPNSDEQIQFATKLQVGDTGAHVGLKFDLRFNLAMVPLLQKFNPTIQVQYFTGYGQSLRQYDVSSHAFRAGLCLSY